MSERSVRMAVVALMAAWCHWRGIAAGAEATLELDAASAYVWRGITINKGAVAQPSLEVGLPAGLSVNVWGNLPLQDSSGLSDENDFSEIDLRVGYAYAWTRLRFSMGYIEYLFPHQTVAGEDGVNAAMPGTRELFVGVTVKLGAGFGAQTEIFYDIDEVEDLYAYLRLSYELELLPKQLCAALSTSAGVAGENWAGFNSDGKDGGLHDYDVALALTWKPYAGLELGAKLARTDTLDKDVLPEQETDWYGIVRIAHTF